MATDQIFRPRLPEVERLQLSYQLTFWCLKLRSCGCWLQTHHDWCPQLSALAIMDEWFEHSRRLPVMKPIQRDLTSRAFLNVFLSMCELIWFMDRCPASQLAVINPVLFPPAVHCCAACEALQWRGRVWRESRVHRWLWVPGDGFEEQSATEHKMP